MSWDVTLNDANGEPVLVPNHSEGGTYALSGIESADLNITYNYSWFFHKCLHSVEGLNWLHGKTGLQTALRLEMAIDDLGTHTFENYWAPTPGNAGHALNILLGWARLHPDAIWRVS